MWLPRLLSPLITNLPQSFALQRHLVIQSVTWFPCCWHFPNDNSITATVALAALLSLHVQQQSLAASTNWRLRGCSALADFVTVMVLFQQICSYWSAVRSRKGFVKCHTLQNLLLFFFKHDKTTQKCACWAVWPLQEDWVCLCWEEIIWYNFISPDCALQCLCVCDRCEVIHKACIEDDCRVTLER